jgi:hypothetical protein
MKTLNFKILSLALLVAGTTCLTMSCKKDEPVMPVKAETKTIEAKDVTPYDKWFYFSFEDDKFVGEGAADPEVGDDAEWANRTDWDIAFHRQNVRTNSGTSGKGAGGILALETEDFDAVKSVDLTTFEADAIVDESILAEFVMPPVYVSSSINAVANNWAILDHASKTWSIAKKNVFIVKTAKGKYAKIQFLNFLNDQDKSGYLTLKYAFQKDGSTKFE